MKKLLVALTAVIFAVGLVLPAAADIPGPAIGDGYHQVYVFNYYTGTWDIIDQVLKECEVFSQGSTISQYRWESDPAASVCDGDYYPPEPEDPEDNNLTVRNYVHYFPWIDMHIVSKDMVWDVFKPGDYMSKAFMIALKANCGVLIHFGSGGPFPVPESFDFDPDDKDGEIVMGPYTVEDVPGKTIDDKQWQYSMLKKEIGKGTPPDVIKTMYWWTQGDIDDWNDPHLMTNLVPDKDNVVDSPHGPFPTGWVLAPTMNCDYTIVPEVDPVTGDPELHFGKYIIFYEDIYIDDCVSEGKYFDEFVITIVPDP